MSVIMSSFTLLIAMFVFGECAVEVQVKSGETTSLLTDGATLYGDYQIIWSKTTETLVHFENGKFQRDPPERFQHRLSLDKATGSINISDLRSEDSGEYVGQIINGDDRVRSFSYNLTVLRSDPVVNHNSTTTVAPSPAPTRRHHWILGLCFGICVCVSFGLFLKGLYTAQGSRSAQSKQVENRPPDIVVGRPEDQTHNLLCSTCPLHVWKK